MFERVFDSVISHTDKKQCHNADDRTHQDPGQLGGHAGDPSHRFPGKTGQAALYGMKYVIQSRIDLSFPFGRQSFQQPLKLVFQCPDYRRCFLLKPYRKAFEKINNAVDPVIGQNPDQHHKDQHSQQSDENRHNTFLHPYLPADPADRLLQNRRYKKRNNKWHQPGQ